VQWIGEADWIYKRTFNVPKDYLQNEQVLLCCEGLDTLATIKINATEIARTDNMFRTYEFDVKNILKPGVNIIEIQFDSTIPYIQQQQEQHPIPLRDPPHGVSGANWVRKEQCNYGWDWGPCLLTCGIWRPVSIVAGRRMKFADVNIGQKHFKDGSVTLDIKTVLTVKEPVTSAGASVTVSLGQNTVVKGNITFKEGLGNIALNIPKPELWWPNGMGKQPLYMVAINLVSKEGTLLDNVTQRIGLRTLHLQRKADKWGSPSNLPSTAFRSLPKAPAGSLPIHLPRI